MCRNARAKAAALTALLLLATAPPPAAAQQQAGALTALSRERLVFQTAYGDLHLAFYPNVRQERMGQSVTGVRTCAAAHAHRTSRRPSRSPQRRAQAAPKTVDHIRRCGELGLYTTNHFFRVGAPRRR